MIYVQKIRKLIYNLLNYYELKEMKYKKKLNYIFYINQSYFKRNLNVYLLKIE